MRPLTYKGTFTGLLLLSLALLVQGCASGGGSYHTSAYVGVGAPYPGYYGAYPGYYHNDVIVAGPGYPGGAPPPGARPPQGGYNPPSGGGRPSAPPAHVSTMPSRPMPSPAPRPMPSGRGGGGGRR